MPKVSLRPVQKPNGFNEKPLIVDAETVAVAIEHASDPFSRVQRVIEESGLDPSQVQLLVSRVRNQFGPLIGELKVVKGAEIVRLLEDRTWRALAYMDDASLMMASAKDKAIITGILLEKRQLLKGEPTQILSTQERAGMSELIPLLMKEIEKRGMAVLQEDDEIEIDGNLQERMTGKSNMAKNWPTINGLKKAERKIESGEP